MEYVHKNNPEVEAQADELQDTADLDNTLDVEIAAHQRHDPYDLRCAA